MVLRGGLIVFIARMGGEPIVERGGKYFPQGYTVCFASSGSGGSSGSGACNAWLAEVSTIQKSPRIAFRLTWINRYGVVVPATGTGWRATPKEAFDTAAHFYPDKIKVPAEKCHRLFGIIDAGVQYIVRATMAAPEDEAVPVLIEDWVPD